MAYAGHKREELLPLLPSGFIKVLDIGCNTGTFGAHLKSQREAEVWGVEPDAAAAGSASKVLDQVRSELFTATVDLPEHYFDVIVFADSLEHFPDTAPPLALCKRLLAPDGRIVCSVPNVRFVGNLEHLLFEKDWRYESAGIRDRTHLRFFTKKSIRRTFEESGYVVSQLVGINEGWWRKDRLARRVLFRLFPGFFEDMRYQQYALVAEPA